MLSSITPLGERGRNNRFAVAATFFVVGSLLGGIAIGALAGGVGALALPHNDAADALVIAVVASGGALLDARITRAHLPTITRQVDERWLQKYRSWVYGLGFGFQLGTGLATIVTSAAVYLMVMTAGLTRSVAAGAVIGAVFGLLRGASILLARRIVTYEQLRRFHHRLADNARRGELVNVGAQAMIGVIGLVASVRVR